MEGVRGGSARSVGPWPLGQLGQAGTYSAEVAGIADVFRDVWLMLSLFIRLRAPWGRLGSRCGARPFWS